MNASLPFSIFFFYLASSTASRFHFPPPLCEPWLLPGLFEGYLIESEPHPLYVFCLICSIVFPLPVIIQPDSTGAQMPRRLAELQITSKSLCTQGKQLRWIQKAPTPLTDRFILCPAALDIAAKHRPATPPHPLFLSF